MTIKVLGKLHSPQLGKTPVAYSTIVSGIDKIAKAYRAYIQACKYHDITIAKYVPSRLAMRRLKGLREFNATR